MKTIFDFDGLYMRQLCYENRTFLRMYFRVDGSDLHYEVCHNGSVWKFGRLQEAIDKYNQEVADGM